MISIYRDFSEIYILSCCFPERKTYINRYKTKNQDIFSKRFEFHFLFASHYLSRKVLYILLNLLSRCKTWCVSFMHYAICPYATLNQQEFIVVFAQETGQNRVFGKKTACSQTTCLETGLNFIYSTDFEKQLSQALRAACGERTSSQRRLPPLQRAFLLSRGRSG